MDKLMLHAVAGSGKTTHILNDLSTEKRSAVITYTVANKESLKKKIVNKFSYPPENIRVFGLFEFLYGFCFRPLQINRTNNGICFDRPPYYLKGYFNDNSQIYSNQLSRFIMREELNYLNRIEKYFDHLYIDEVQDLHSDDFDWLMTLSNLKIPVTLVGDFYQSTFATSRRGNKSATLFSNYTAYKRKFENNGYHFDESTLNKSYRCSRNISEFVTSNLGIDMDSHNLKESEIEVIDEKEEIVSIMNNNNIKKLFYNKSSTYLGNCDNWGNSKGQQFNDVCVILNPATLKIFPDKLYDLAPTTLKKLYVACTRSKNNLYFINQELVPKTFIK
ncbi:hypothetical protein [Jeotgalicoccus sp. WY2]|uniref:hypothetical protein n=1 Tax=Jeotgalicoccus sp. WY2 TaxID=2708346 RepID=UPI001BD3DC98|nr:hypothetical protein [Jeotgalicoccus sp. WY2]